MWRTFKFLLTVWLFVIAMMMIGWGAMLYALRKPLAEVIRSHPAGGNIGTMSNK